LHSKLIFYTFPSLLSSFSCPQELDETSAAVLGAFFVHYHGMVRFHSSASARERVLAALADGVSGSGADTWLQRQAAASSGGGGSDGGGGGGPRPRLEALALAWALRQTGAAAVVVGARTPTHVDANLSAAAWAAAPVR